MSFGAKVAAMVLACVSTATLAAQTAFTEVRVPHGAGLADKKDPRGVGRSPNGNSRDVDVDGSDVRRPERREGADPESDVPLLATLDQVHSGERVVLDAHSPTQARFDALLADGTTGERHALDPRLLELLRALAGRHPNSRIELVSGYRSPKHNEMLRKKGHHVASHSQHSLGHACDFRIVPPGADQAIDPRVVEAEVRQLGWDGGVGVYPTSSDWFVHADVGRLRRWVN
jgi:uncharacterized protein YcbK (DUF882 family)